MDANTTPPTIGTSEPSTNKEGVCTNNRTGKQRLYAVQTIEQGNFSHGCQHNSTNNKVKRSAKVQANYLSQKQDREKDREERLHGLDGVREGDSHLAQTHIGENISKHVDQSKRQDLCILHHQTKTTAHHISHMSKLIL
jgi:hypothetical protein